VQFAIVTGVYKYYPLTWGQHQDHTEELGIADITGIADAPLIELEPTVSVSPPTSAHAYVYEPVDVIDVDEPVWILRTTEPPATTTSTQSTCYVAHSTVLLRTALPPSQSKGTVPTAHTTPQMQSQYLHLTLRLLPRIYTRRRHLLLILQRILVHMHLLQFPLYLFLLLNLCHLYQHAW